MFGCEGLTDERDFVSLVFMHTLFNQHNLTFATCVESICLCTVHMTRVYMELIGRWHIRKGVDVRMGQRREVVCHWPLLLYDG